ncbi:plasmid-related protein [Roseovarius sp. E0-M6]|uniref:plasmid-related protein n=1 Tax=Roseovarius sp. E0-M6 TaxID=3127118 RepID=UPI00301003C8
MKKNVGLRIRIDRDLREQFLKACQADDKPAAQVLREFMRAYVAERGLDSAIIDGGVKEKDNGVEP